MAKKGKKGKVSRYFAKARRRVRSRGITIPIGRTIGLVATGAGLASKIFTPYVQDSISKGNISGVLTGIATAAQQNLQPAGMIPVIMPGITTAIVGFALDAFRANPKMRVGRFTVKAM